MSTRTLGKLWAAVLLSLAGNTVWAQNHVANPSFETHSWRRANLSERARSHPP